MEGVDASRMVEDGGVTVPVVVTWCGAGIGGRLFIVVVRHPLALSWHL
jgi:hypothetical protein